MSSVGLVVGRGLKLLHDFQSVRFPPMLDHFAARDPQDVDAAEMHPVVSWRAHLVTFMGANSRPADGSEITIADDGLNGGGQIRENSEVHRRQLIHPVDALPLAGERVVLDITGVVSTIGKARWRGGVPNLDEVFRDFADPESQFLES